MSSINILSLFLVTITIFASCGKSPDTVTPNEQTVNRELVPLDSIGIEFGDSNYVFGMPRAVEFTSQGNIVVGDISSMKLMMYSPDGTFICSGGSEGQGPGEYAAPSGISSTPSGGIVVSDAMGGKLIFYDSLLDYSHELTGFIPQPPGKPEILDDGSIVGTRFAFDQEAGKLSNTLSMWKPGETEVSFDYFERTSSFDQQNPMKVYQETGINYCVLQDGRVIVSPVSTEEYSLTCYNTENAVDWEIHPTYEKTRRSEEDVEIEREMIRIAMQRNGQDGSYADQLELQEWTNAVTGLFAQKDRIWVRRGSNLEPLFDIYSTDGDFLYSCSVPYLPFGSNIAFTISPYSSTILAFQANPEDYPKIWILQEVDGLTGEPFVVSPVPDIPSDSPEPTQCTLSVHSDLEPFEISLYSVGPPEVSSGFRQIHTLTVSPLGQDMTTVFDGLEANYYDGVELDEYFVAEDMNFDGFTDFRLMESPSAGPNTYWYFWLFNPETNMFQRAREYENSNLVSPEFIKDDKMIICFHRDGMGMYGTDYYVIENNAPVLTKTEETEYLETDSVITTVTELIDGEMVVTDRSVQGTE